MPYLILKKLFKMAFHRYSRYHDHHHHHHHHQRSNFRTRRKSLSSDENYINPISLSRMFNLVPSFNHSILSFIIIFYLIHLQIIVMTQTLSSSSLSSSFTSGHSLCKYNHFQHSNIHLNCLWWFHSLKIKEFFLSFNQWIIHIRTQLM